MWCSLGSANFDTRSFRVNDEANLNIWDEDFARQQIELLTADRQHCRVYEYERWRKRPWPRRLIEHCAALLRSQL